MLSVKNILISFMISSLICVLFRNVLFNFCYLELSLALLGAFVDSEFNCVVFKWHALRFQSFEVLWLSIQPILVNIPYALEMMLLMSIMINKYQLDQEDCHCCSDLYFNHLCLIILSNIMRRVLQLPLWLKLSSFHFNSVSFYFMY